MKKFFILLFLVLASMTASAQVEGGEIGEVTVSGRRATDKRDGKWIYPSEEELRSSSNGYSLLQKLSLPGIHVDVLKRGISSVDNRGEVGLRINGVPATQQDMLALDMNAVMRIEYIDRPGLRYGENVVYVINIITKRARSGYVLGTEQDYDLMMRNLSENVFARMNMGKSEFGANYTFGYSDMKGVMTKETADYVLNDGTVKTIIRQDLENRNRNASHSAQLSYSISDTSYVLQSRLSYYDIRSRIYRKRMLDNGIVPTDKRSIGDSRYSTFDIYYHRDFKRHQNITASAVVTNIDSDGEEYDDEVTPYIYNVDGRVWSLKSEAIYENILKPFTIDLGMQYNRKLTDNRYTGDASARSLFRSSEQYFYGQISGSLARLQYTVGIGGSNRYYRQGKHSNHHFVLRPKVDVSYPLWEGWQLSYTFDCNQHVSQIAVINDVALRTNSMEMVVGNPDLKPNRVIEHVLRLTVSKPRLMAMLQGYAKLNPNSNMRRTIRTADNIFIDTQTNQPHCNLLMGMAYARYDIIPHKLVASASAQIFECDNKGDDYRHRYTSFMGVASLNAYLGKWTLTAYAETGFRWMEGETRGRNGVEVQFVAGYQSGPLTLSLNCRNPFRAHPMIHRAEKMNVNLHKITTIRNADAGNYVSLSVALKLQHGRKYRDIRRRINLKDRDAGILK